MYQKVINFIIKIYIVFFSKKVFYKPRKKKNIIFNKNSKDIIFFFGKNFQILPIISQEINFYILFKIFFKFKFTTLDYYKEYILSIQPKNIVTFIDNDLIFYKLKIFFKNIRFVSIQNGVRLEGPLSSKVNKNKLFCDLVCLIGRQEKKFYKSIKSKFAVVGSILNNQSYKNFNINRSKNKIIAFISQYRVPENFLFKDSYYDNYYNNNEAVLLPILASYCQIYNLELVIMGCCYENSNKNFFEYNYYKSILDRFIGLKWNFLYKKNNYSNYYFLDKVSLVVSFESTLGLEALARGIKVLRFQREIYQYSKNSWIYNNKNIKYFSYNFDKEIIFKKLHSILSKNRHYVVKSFNKINLSSLIKLDPSNKLLKKLLFN